MAVLAAIAVTLALACEVPAEPNDPQPTDARYLYISGSPIADLNGAYGRMSSSDAAALRFSADFMGGRFDASKPVFHRKITRSGGAVEDWYVWSSTDGGYRISQLQSIVEWLFENPDANPKAESPELVKDWYIARNKTASGASTGSRTKAPITIEPRVGIESVSLYQQNKAANWEDIQVTVSFDGEVTISGSPTFTLNFTDAAGTTTQLIATLGMAAPPEPVTAIFFVTKATVKGTLSSEDNAIMGGSIKDAKGLDAILRDTKVAGIQIGPNIVYPTGVTVNPSNSTMNVFSTLQLAATVFPTGADQSVTWSSNNAAVAAVDANGLVTATNTTGTVTITAISAVDSTKQGTATITVVRPSANGVTITPATSTITIGGPRPGTPSDPASGDVQLSATVAPQGADQTVTWSSSNNNIARVDANGLVTPALDQSGRNNPGTVTITATSSSGVRGTASVTVRRPAIVSVEVRPDTATIQVGQTVQLSANVIPQGADPAVTWSSANAAIATVDANGLVTAGSTTGTVAIRATASDGTVGSSTITVTRPSVTGVTVTPANSTLELGSQTNGSVQLSASVAPSGADQSVTWSSSDAAIASVDQTGLVTVGNTAGTATITATSTSSGVRGTASVTVRRPDATGVTVTPANSTLEIGSQTNGSVQLSASVSPQGADQSVTWSSSDTSIASVGQNGLVTAGNTPGTVTITATSTSASGVRGTASVTVRRPVPTFVNITPNSAIINVGETVQFSATVSPQGADPTIRWSSYDPAIASVDATGLVTGVSPGSTRLLAEANNGTSSAPRVTVRPYPTSATISPRSPVVQVGSSIQLTATVAPQDADQTITWSSDDPSIASVDQNGNVTGHRAGSSTRINATAYNGVLDRVSISVVQ